MKILAAVALASFMIVYGISVVEWAVRWGIYWWGIS